MKSPLLLILFAASLNACSTSPKPARSSALTPAEQADQDAWQEASQRALEDVHQAGNEVIRIQTADQQ